MRRADTQKVVRSFTMGPSTLSLAEIKPIEALPWICLSLPLLVVTSSTLDSLPPKREGKLPLYSVTFFTASALKAEKKPPRWFTL